MNCVDSIKYGVCEDTHLKTLQNLSEGEVRFFQSLLPLIPQPPANSSIKTEEEIFQLYDLQVDKRSQIRETIKVIDMDLTEPFLNLCSMLKVNPLQHKVDECLDKGQKISLFYKAHFNRARPFQVSLFYTSNFAPMASISAWTASYPSGHTIQAEMLCMMYCRAYPKHSHRFKQIAELISYSRLVGGFHFQSDIEVGKHIVELINGRRI
jgi:acid phosphatase (class A)